MYRDSQIIHSLSRLQFELSFSSYVTGLTDTQLYTTRLYITLVHAMYVHTIYMTRASKREREKESSTVGGSPRQRMQ